MHYLPPGVYLKLVTMRSKLPMACLLQDFTLRSLSRFTYPDVKTQLFLHWGHSLNKSLLDKRVLLKSKGNSDCNGKRISPSTQEGWKALLSRIIFVFLFQGVGVCQKVGLVSHLSAKGLGVLFLFLQMICYVTVCNISLILLFLMRKRLVLNFNRNSIRPDSAKTIGMWLSPSLFSNAPK